MEEKKFDLNSLIGFILLGAIMVWWMYSNQPTPEEIAKQKEAQIQDSIQQAQQATSNIKTIDSIPSTESVITSDSLNQVAIQNQLGAFAYSASLPYHLDLFLNILNVNLTLEQLQRFWEAGRKFGF